VIHDPVPFAIAATGLGLLVGSFLNVVAARLPARLAHDFRVQCHEMLNLPLPQERPPGIFWGRSRCPSCQQVIAWYDNIPLLSYMVLRGRCRHCGARIPPQYPLVEALTAGLSLLASLRLGAGWATMAAIVLIWLLIVLAVIDWRHQLLPDVLIFPGLWAGLLLGTQDLFVTCHSAIFGAAAGYLILRTVAEAFHLLTGRVGMGHGDFKLLALIGAWLGWQALLPVVLVGCLFGLGAAAVRALLFGIGRQTPLPFGPALAAGAVCYLLIPTYELWLYSPGGPWPMP
jgi:leader peptidase (prepilin peptidase)/N-methyltransferase